MRRTLTRGYHCHGTCKHCQAEKYIEARGLCRQCFMDLAIRHQYPSRLTFECGGVRDVNIPVTLPAEPCEHSPGSRERLATLAARAERKESLFHPHDARI